MSEKETVLGKRKRDPSKDDEEIERLKKKFLTEEEFQKRVSEMTKKKESYDERMIDMVVKDIAKKCIRGQREICDDITLQIPIYGKKGSSDCTPWRDALRSLIRVVDVFKVELQKYHFRIFDWDTHGYRVVFCRRNCKETDEGFRVIQSK